MKKIDPDMKKNPEVVHGSSANTSYGILLFTLSDSDDVLFLVAKRRYTYAYTEFLFRKNNKRGNQYLIRDMTLKEIAQLISYKYERLWEDYHLESFNDTSLSYADYSFKRYAHNLFNENIQKCRRSLLIEIDRTNDNEDKVLWEFPKGKLNVGEGGKECALREFSEETGIVTKNFVTIEDVFSEDYIGDDGISYSTVLYPMFVRDYKDLKVHRKRSEFAFSDNYISSEIRMVKWLNREGCSQVLSMPKMKIVNFIVAIMKEVIKAEDRNR